MVSEKKAQRIYNKKRKESPTSSAGVLNHPHQYRTCTLNSRSLSRLLYMDKKAMVSNAFRVLHAIFIYSQPYTHTPNIT